MKSIALDNALNNLKRAIEAETRASGNITGAKRQRAMNAFYRIEGELESLDL
jgi:hypothetical protein